MNNEEWNSSSSAIEMLNALREYSGDAFIQRVKSLQRFYIRCCRRKLFLLPQPEFKNGLDIAEAYIKNKATRKEVSKQNWKTEGEVFGIEYNTDPSSNKLCLLKMRLYTGLRHDKAREYAISFGYFIDWTMLYATDFNGEVPERHSHFLSACILKNEVRNPFDR